MNDQEAAALRAQLSDATYKPKRTLGQTALIRIEVEAEQRGFERGVRAALEKVNYLARRVNSISEEETQKRLAAQIESLLTEQ